MKKETSIAIFFGVLLGLIVAVVIVLRLRQFEGQKPIPAEGQITPKIMAKNAELQPLEITAPDQNLIVGQDSVTVKGKASKDSLLIIQTPIKDVAVKNSKGDFSVKVPLSLGENTIVVSAYPKGNQSNPQTKTLKVYYLNEL